MELKQRKQLHKQQLTRQLQNHNEQTHKKIHLILDIPTPENTPQFPK